MLHRGERLWKHSLECWWLTKCHFEIVLLDKAVRHTFSESSGSGPVWVKSSLFQTELHSLEKPQSFSTKGSGHSSGVSPTGDTGRSCWIKCLHNREPETIQRLPESGTMLIKDPVLGFLIVSMKLTSVHFNRWCYPVNHGVPSTKTNKELCWDELGCTCSCSSIPAYACSQMSLLLLLFVVVDGGGGGSEFLYLPKFNL